MPKTYFNNGIIGNSSMLGCITDTGELVRLYWPNIDYPQHLDKFLTGLFFPGKPVGTSWLDSEDWSRQQKYIPDTNIMETGFINRNNSIIVNQRDFVLPHKDILVRHYEFENTGESEIEAGFMLYSSAVSTNAQMSCILFNFKYDSLVHYRHNYYVSISADADAWKFQLGNDAFNCAGRVELNGNDSIGMMHDGAMSWMLGRIMPGMRRTLNLYICTAHTLKDLKETIREAKAGDYSRKYAETERYWKELIKGSRSFITGNAEIDELYRRSILVFKLMSDKNTGGLLASAEIDEEFTKCGRYAYCWGRDAAFITGALDVCGLHDDVDKFYRWAAEVQDEEGSWQQRYHLDGNLAPSWGLQIDETGTILWGILRHYKVTGRKDFLLDMWECIRRGAGFLLDFMDPDTGLPWLSFDLWEERLGEHAYSTAAVYGGIMSAVEVGCILKKPEELLEKWRTAAAGLKNAIGKNFWKQEWQRFIRSIRVKLNPWGEEHTQDKVYMKIDSKGNHRDFTCEDWKVDISLLGLTVPFGVYKAGNPMMEGTLKVVEQVLACPVSGGLKRYENDDYAGGNPWLIAALWAALYHIENRNYGKAREYFYWAAGCRTQLGLLPEQADKETGKPAWVIPLTWSHAMFVLVLEGLVKGEGW
ncbi:MAG: glycoside hydrolase [Clostridiales bacterium GWC2_40_7]|nr:MAG: glycoside hydrolase [Clostridiales bacterium GWC2_40_7]